MSLISSVDMQSSSFSEYTRNIWLANLYWFYGVFIGAPSYIPSHRNPKYIIIGDEVIDLRKIKEFKLFDNDNGYDTDIPNYQIEIKGNSPGLNGGGYNYNSPTGEVIYTPGKSPMEVAKKHQTNGGGM